MNLVLADTHVLIWLLDGRTALGRGTRDLIDEALGDDRFCVSAITFWEVTMLAGKGRIQLQRSPESWRRAVLDLGVTEIPLTGNVVVSAAILRNFHGDLIDRFVTATAISSDAALITADRQILGWQGEATTWDAGR
ncbi:MAG: type II toxin-antitoxin system VapC family toxin [Rhodospirillaceae bacterium]|nr:type II toxin-antitoxin system VapC family toxin [Rhodospirillales bacterium]MBT3904851.1 type II toxin-antitoxin system VapC family toxin [Rhodospirillaceae bacterium]MBT4702814.1 type II toxin-antitoxin system VapC family toxin [Rhodospirillaceae bacterium]MBT5036351.1 type II toxin-antitoxin system VapC family toxin [Rhodospirillaceae bacterium]MBT6222253.1 type II toxin-antitoxin system VapC family toxin [Rhodospirillaceae bacterium]